jgi:Sec-independent protein translocase protein TatA
MKLLIGVLLFILFAIPAYADVTGSYIGSSSSHVSFLQLVQAGSGVSGSIKAIDESAKSPGYVINEVNLTGSAHGDSLYIRVDNGWLGSSGLFTGEVDGSVAIIHFPLNNGTVSTSRFRRASSDLWNSQVASFEARATELYNLRILGADYSAAAATFNSARADIPACIQEIKATVADLSADHTKEAQAEALVDQANAADVKLNAAMADLTKDQQRLTDDIHAHQGSTPEDSGMPTVSYPNWPPDDANPALSYSSDRNYQKCRRRWALNYLTDCLDGELKWSVVTEKALLQSNVFAGLVFHGTVDWAVPCVSI